MSDAYNPEQIRDFWAKQALEHGQSPAASWSDQPVIDMEIRQIIQRLTDGQEVLDIGCANGYSTLQFASQKKIHIRGLDYIPGMIEQAQQRLSGLKDKLPGRVEFATGDITALKEPAGRYDAVVVIRVIINLATWENQLRGLRECVRVLKPGGMLLLSEATLQGWQQLNKFRNEWGLADIPMPKFNQYLDQDQVVAALAGEMDLVELVNFASSYYVGTRVLKPLLAQALASGIDVSRPEMEWNRWFSQWPAIGDYGTQKLFVFRKR